MFDILEQYEQGCITEAEANRKLIIRIYTALLNRRAEEEAILDSNLLILNSCFMKEDSDGI